MNTLSEEDAYLPKSATSEADSNLIDVSTSKNLGFRWLGWSRFQWVVAFLYAPIFLYEIPFAATLTWDWSLAEMLVRIVAMLAYVAATLLLLTWVAWQLLFACIDRSTIQLRQAVKGLLLAACLWFAGPYVASRLRAFGFYMIGRRAEPVISAMESYVTKHGAPPTDIQFLIPEHLPSLPANLSGLDLSVKLDVDPNRPSVWGLDIERTVAIPLGTEVLTYQSTGFAEPGERLGRWVLRFKPF